ncbi:hypothetical protein GGF46_000502 [Coemansia sp. RSA 552]|nr:hypothetical protein GGF46_000502 [Coemansia sp. RSA 552]
MLDAPLSSREPSAAPTIVPSSEPEAEDTARQVQIQAIPHSTMAADAEAPKSSFGSNEDNLDDDADDGAGLPYGLPSASNGKPLGLRQAADGGPNDDVAAPESGRKVSGLRAALASRFAAKKKPKDLRTAASVSSKRQQHQLESLMSQSVVGDNGDGLAGPTVGGQSVGFPMSFHHVEHLSPTEIAPKMPLINGQLHKPAAPTAKGAPTERKLSFRNFKPASLLTKPSKQLSSSSLGDSGKGGGITVRGKPIGAPMGFQHVEHMSPNKYSMEQFHLLNHRQQQSEIVSVLRQNSRKSTSQQQEQQQQQQQQQQPLRSSPSLNVKPEKITYRGLPLSGPVSFEHVEHMSAQEYRDHMELSARTAAAQPLEYGDDDGYNNNGDDYDDEDSGPDPEITAAERPRLVALQHTAQAIRTSASDLGPGRSPRLPQTLANEIQNRGSRSPSTSSDNAKGIAKVREISSPFNVQHDVHISVEDLDDLMQQVPDTLKPYLSPARSPQSDHRSSDAQEPPQTPIYEEMTGSRRRRSTGEGEIAAAAAQMARSRSGGPHDGGPDTPGWLPRIESVSSPAGASPQGLRKQRAVSGHSASMFGGSLGHRASHMSASDIPLSQAEHRASTPVSAPIHSGMSPNGTGTEQQTCETPNTPQSAAPRIGSSEVDASAAPSTWDTKDGDDDDDGKHAKDGDAEKQQQGDEARGATGRPARQPDTEGVAGAGALAEAAHSKWIKRKSRAMSTLGIGMLGKHISKTTVPVPTLVPDNEKRHTLSPDSMSSAAMAKAAAFARLEMNSTAPVSTSSLPPTNPFHTLGGEEGSGEAKEGGRSSERSSGHRNPRDANASRPSTAAKSSRKRRENYGELEEYAEGESGNVFIAVRKAPSGKRPRGEHVAIKVVPKSAKSRYRKLRTELKILRRIRSQHVVRFYEYFSIDDAVWIVYEFMGRGSITDLLAGYPEIRMPAITISYVMHEVLTALAYLHERHIIHCDVRSDNVLIDDKGQVKLADFSSAVFLDADQASAQKTSLGAIYWMAPELAKGAGYSGGTDVWAAGALLYEMLEGQPPYIEYPNIKVLELSSANGMPKLTSPDACDPGLVELMNQCTAISQHDRPQASRLRKHESVMALDSAQCAQLMVDFVLQVESLEDDDDVESCGDPC